ncbi:pore-forming ESAT-6 family protein [Acetobacterium wieringae]|uniref:pore-forming ESAT-6 family protein n=1 Tax=Acetobacterium wieringae TaxID=52694 RepID=UPI003158E4E2
MAAIEGIKITLGEVSKTSTTIRSLNQSLDTKLTDMQSQVNALSNTWTSDAGNTIVQKMKNMSGRFEEYKKVIESYASFLDQTVINYDSVETNINRNAEAFK